MSKNKFLTWLFIISLLVQSVILGLFFGKIKAEAHVAGICNGMFLKNCEAATIYNSTSIDACKCGGYDAPIAQTASALDMYSGAYYMSICDNSWP